MSYKEFLDSNRLNIAYAILAGALVTGAVVSWTAKGTGPTPTTDNSQLCSGVLPEPPPKLSWARVVINERHLYDFLSSETAARRAEQFVKEGGCYYGA